MSRKRGKARHITPAQRGAVVQRVLVDRWTVAEAAAAFHLAERQVAGWVAAYRRHGMASLRDEAAVARAAGRWLWLLQIMAVRLAARLRRRFDGSITTEQRSIGGKVRRGPPPPAADTDRRGRWR